MKREIDVAVMYSSAAQILLEIVEEYHHRGITVCFVKLRERCKVKFLRSGIYDLVGPGHFFRKIREAIEYLRNNDQLRGDVFHAEAPSGSSDNNNGHGSGRYDWTVPDQRRGSLFSSGSYASEMPYYGDHFADSTPGSDFLMNFDPHEVGGRDPSPYRSGGGVGTVGRLEEGRGGRRSPTPRGSRRGLGGRHLRVTNGSRRSGGDGAGSGVDGDVVDLFSDSEPEFGPPDDFVERPGVGGDGGRGGGENLL